ncbi:MAG: hypothetical protein LUC30_08400 [Clostridiales bacterium]|nr:hypothetical protein [Clostridiales bacterium]
MLSGFAYEGQERVPLRLRLDSGTCLEEEITQLTLTAGCSSGTSGPSLGSTVATYLTASLAGDGLPALEGAYVTPEVELDGAWLSLGRFRFETPETGEGTVKITASDAMIWAMEAGYYPSDPAPTTALEVLADICDQAGVALGDVSGLNDAAVSGVSSGYTCREMAGYMAALLGRNALFDREGVLVLRWFSAADAAVGPEDYYSGGFTRKDYDYVLASLTVSTGSGEDDQLSAGTGGSGISLTDPYMTEATLETVWAGLEGFTYRPGEVTVAGDLRLEPGDIITVTDLAGDCYTFPVMNVEHTYDGGFQTKLSAYGSAESDSSASYKGPATTALERYTADMASFQNLFADKAYLQDLLVRGGIVTDTLSGVEINATRYLTGVTIVGDVIQAGTLTADKLILTGADGLFYEINATAGGLTAAELTEEQYQTAIDGSVLVANSVTADRINVTDLFAQDITATGTITGATIKGATGDFSGSITCGDGTIGGFTVGQNAIYRGLASGSPEEDGAGIYLGDRQIVSAVTADTYVRFNAGYLDGYGYDEDAAQRWYFEQAAGIGMRFWKVGDAGGLDNGISSLYGPEDCDVAGTLTVFGTICHGENQVSVKCVQRGNLTITPSAANTPTGSPVEYSGFQGTPFVTATAVSSSPGKEVTGVSVYGSTSGGTTIYVTRTNTTNTGVNWVAVY